MKRGLSFVAALLAAPAVAQVPAPASPPLAPELQQAVSCAALFSLVAADQARGTPSAQDWPPLAQRGREFFVRVAAAAMDQAGLDRAGIQALMQAEAAALQRTDPAMTYAMRAGRMKAECLTLLELTVPPVAGR